MILDIFGRYFHKDFLTNELEYLHENQYGDTVAHFKNGKDVYWWRQHSAKQVFEEINRQLTSISGKEGE